MSDESQQTPTQPGPSPEVLHVPGEEVDESTEDRPVAQVIAHGDKPVAHRVAYRPTHKGTFVGLTVVALIILANIAIISLVMRSQAVAEEEANDSVTISTDTLSKLGVSRNAVGNADTELTVGPNAIFSGKVTMGRDVTIAGQLNLNSKFTANEASLKKLEAGETAVEQINVNGDATISTLSLREDLQVAGAARIQGQLSVNQLVTINNNMNVAGNLAIGGQLSVRDFQVSNLKVAGHLISGGAVPAVSVGGGAGSNGTVSVGGNDMAGTVAVNMGVGAGNGLLASITFRQQYSSTPHVVVTPVGRSVPGLYINRTSAGFTISADGGLAPGGYAFDYVIVE